MIQSTVNILVARWGCPVFEPGCEYCLLSVAVEVQDAKRRRARKYGLIRGS